MRKRKYFVNRTDHNLKLRPAARAAAIRAALSGSDQCSALGVVARGGAPVIGLCRRLIETGIDPATALHVYRDNTLCLIVHAIGEAARLEINSHGTGFIALRGRRTASPIDPPHVLGRFPPPGATP